MTQNERRKFVETGGVENPSRHSDVTRSYRSRYLVHVDSLIYTISIEIEI